MEIKSVESDSNIRPAKVINQMRKWGLHFKGKDSWAFLERIEELKKNYEYTDQQFFRRLPATLPGGCVNLQGES